MARKPGRSQRCTTLHHHPPAVLKLRGLAANATVRRRRAARRAQHGAGRDHPRAQGHLRHGILPRIKLRHGVHSPARGIRLRISEPCHQRTWLDCGIFPDTDESWVVLLGCGRTVLHTHPGRYALDGPGVDAAIHHRGHSSRSQCYHTLATEARCLRPSRK